MDTISSFNVRINTYLLLHDKQLYDKLQNTLLDIRKYRGEYRYMFSLDGFDYDDNSEEDYHEEDEYYQS